jgi:undecaprenyldiphospho-muramoylpentapeptide beta-N-acetylglucosaminyltransferase
MTTFAVLAGGGTAGHVLPALALADALVARGHPRESLQFVGARRGMEAAMVPDAGYPLLVLEVEGVRRSLSFSTIRAAWRFALALPRAVALLRRLRPRVVVSVGGYASVPAVVAAALLRIPIVGVSYDAKPGAASRLGARLARATAVAFEPTSLPRAVCTGTPLRGAVAGLDRAHDRVAARAALGLPTDRFTLFAFGGSLGSGKLNEVVAAYAAARAARRDLAVRHVVGRRNEASAPASAERPDGLWYQVVRYEDRMELGYAAADLVLARAGAVTIAELAATGQPALLVPWPLATEDHQTANARVLAAAGGAVVIPEAELTPERLAAEVDRLQEDPAVLAAMGAAARSVGRRDAADAVADLVERHALPPREPRR